ncbi:phosphotriesterase [Chloroflexota bacterium]
MKKTELTGKVQSVLGVIDADSAGITLYHEHLLSDMSAWLSEPTEASDKRMANQPVTLENLYWIHANRFANVDNARLGDEQLAIKEAMQYKCAGGNTIIEASSNGLARDPLGLTRIARATGLNVIMGSGYYVAPSHPPEMARKTGEEITREIVRDIMVGVGDTGVRAGIIGEIGCSSPLQENERKVLRAAAGAQRQTGAGLLIHPGFGDDMVLEIINILDDAGADLGHTAICHTNVRSYSPATQRKLADAGCFIGYESFGDLGYSHMSQGNLRETRSDIEYIEDIARLVADGYLSKILIALDICFKDSLTAYGGYGYAHILRNVLPVMRLKGFSDEQINTILVENPKNLLQFAPLKD